jgi:hypothetical protein
LDADAINFIVGVMQNGRSVWQLAMAIITLVIAVNFLTMPAEKYAGDADAVRVQTFTLLNAGEWAIPQEIAASLGQRGQYFYQNANGNWYPKYGVLNTLIYAPALWFEQVTPSDLDSARNLLALNLTNLVLSSATAFYLVLLSCRYTKSSAVITIFVLASLYSTFWWNYLRAQTFEIYHTLFILAFYYHFVTALRLYRPDENKRRRDSQFFITAIYFGALCLCKSVYVVLLPAIAAILARAELGPGMSRKGRLLRQLLFFWLPVCIFLSILAVTNWGKFGSPFATGYTQWEKESELFKLTNVLPALWGFVFSARGSAFLYYPVLLFALAGWPMFFKKHKLDAITAGLIGLSLLLVNSAFANWRGEASYGPRYLLPMLPVLSLPFIEYLSWLISLSNKAIRSLLVAGTAALLAYSMLLQVCVNTMPFFFCYNLKDILDDPHHSKPATYLRFHHCGTINRDFLLFRLGRASPFTARFIHHLNPSESERMNWLNKSVRANYYWFPNLLPEGNE